MKAKNIFTLLFVLFLLPGFVGCSFEPYDDIKRKPEAAKQREYLALLKAGGEYTISEEKLEDMIIGLLNPKPDGRNVIENKQIKITGSKKLPIAKKQKTSDTRYAANSVDKQNFADIYIYATENINSGTEGYVLASPDMRTGNILAVVDGGSMEDEEAWFTNVIFDGLAGYIEHTVNQYNSISEEEIRQTLEKPGIRTIAPSRSSGSGLEILDNAGTGLVHHWHPDAAQVIAAEWAWTDGHEARVPVNWFQGNPYNYYVTRARNGRLGDYIAGCGPVAVAQIMAYHGYPPKCTLNETIPNVNLNINNYTYNWSSMRNDFSAIGEADPISGGAKDIAVLMYEIGHPQRGNADYQYQNGTYSYPEDLTTAFKKMGYKTPSNFVSYDHNIVKSSIISGRPVLMVGWSDITGGHFWVVDGVRLMTHYTEWYADGSGGGLMWTNWNFVHCNTGWHEYWNRWCISGIFDFYSLSHARSNMPHYYQYGVAMLPNVHP